MMKRKLILAAARRAVWWPVRKLPHWVLAGSKGKGSRRVHTLPQNFSEMASFLIQAQGWQKARETARPLTGRQGTRCSRKRTGGIAHG